MSRGVDPRDAAYVEYVAARQAHLRRIAYAVCGDWHRADDVLQTALTKLYLAWPRLRDDTSPDAYVRRIIVRTDIDERRRPWRRERPGLAGHDAAARSGRRHRGTGGARGRSHRPARDQHAAWAGPARHPGRCADGDASCRGALCRGPPPRRPSG